MMNRRTFSAALIGWVSASLISTRGLTARAVPIVARNVAASTEDRTINPDPERFMAKRMGGRTIEVKSSHLSMTPHPDEITRLSWKRPDTALSKRRANT